MQVLIFYLNFFHWLVMLSVQSDVFAARECGEHLEPSRGAHQFLLQDPATIPVRVVGGVFCFSASQRLVIKASATC